MFVQVFQGRVSDAGKVREHFGKWLDEQASQASGWLGSTAGVTEDGRFIALARFESEEAARANSDRPEQGEWWKGMEALFTDTPVFHDSTDVDVDTAGDPGQARFVQVMQGRTSDPQRARELMASDPTDWSSFRPEILGSVSVYHDDDSWTMAIYFTTEEEAREGERKEMPPEAQRIMEELNQLTVGEIEYFDLKEPWLHAPA